MRQRYINQCNAWEGCFPTILVCIRAGICMHARVSSIKMQTAYILIAYVQFSCQDSCRLLFATNTGGAKHPETDCNIV